MSERAVRFRLVAGATLFAAIAIGASLIAGRLVIDAQLRGSAEALARSDLTPFLTDLRLHPDEPPDPPGPGVQVGIQSAGGDWIIDTLPDEVHAAVDGRRPGTLDVSDGDGDRSWTVAADTARTDDGEVTLWAARETTAAGRSLRSIDLFFVAGGLGLAALFAVAATLFVRGALRPVEEARRRERQFVSAAAHELRTPVTSLRGQLGIVRRRLGDRAAAEEELLRAEASAARLGDLASNLLELARLDEGTPQAAASLVALRQAFLAAVDDVRATPEAGGVEIEQLSPAVLPEGRAELDAVSFGRIVRNLLANAVAATGAGGTIVAELSSDPERLVLAVQDDGPGMDPEFLARARERFTRGGGQGSGLGLALVDALARSAGGHLELVNTEPGFRAIVSLPTR